MASIIILADDLSGAAELAGLAVGCGLSAAVQRGLDSAAAADVIAIDTNSRLLTTGEAAERQRAIVSTLGGLAGRLVFKKADSLLRGNVRAEIEAILQAGAYRRAILVPANPSRGRTIGSGRYLVDGKPLDETPLARDPHHPRLTSDIAALLGEGSEPLHFTSASAELPATGILVPDATTPDDLVHLASQIDGQTLAAGAADFFGHVLASHAHPSLPSKPCPGASLIRPPALLVCGSRLAWPARRQAAADAKITLLECDPGHGLFPGDAPVYALGFGDREVGPKTALWAVSSLAATIIAQLPVRTVLVEGGETAAALAEKHGWLSFQVAGAAPAGVGVLRPLAPNAPLVLAKPGSYAWPEEIWAAFCELVRK